MDFSFNEKQIAQQLTARRLSGLFEMLLELKGLILNQNYTLRWLYAVGGQSILYLAEGGDGQRVLVKIALLPYHRAAYISLNDIHLARLNLEREAASLRRFSSTVLPEFYDLIYAVNPLHSSARGKEVVNEEPYLVMEYIVGRTLLEVTRTIHVASLPHYEALESLAWQIAEATIDFFILISEQEHPYLYSDFNPHNLILCENPNKPVRILDAGSIIPLQTHTPLSPPFSWAYIPPEYYKAYDKGKVLWPTPSYAIYSLGKVLWEALTNRQPFPAEDPDLSEPKLKNYSRSLQNLIHNLITRKFGSFKQVEQEIKSDSFSVPPSNITWSDLLATSKQVSTDNFVPMEFTSAPQFASLATVMKLTKVYSTRIGAVQRLRYSPDGHYIAIASRNRVELWDAQNLRLVRRFNTPHIAPVVSLDFDSTGKFLASGSSKERDGIICLWHTDDDDIIWQHKVIGFNGDVALDAQGELLAAATKWSSATFYPHRAIQTGSQFECLVDKGTCIAIGKQQALLAVGGLGGIRLWKYQTHTELGLFRLEHGMFVVQMAFGNVDQTLAALILDTHHSIFIWDVPSSRVIWKVEKLAPQITDIKLEPAGRFVFAGSLSGHLWVWDSEHSTECTHLVDCGRISSVDFASDQQTLAAATLDGEVSIYYLDRH